MSLVSEALRKARREAAERGDNLDGRTAQTTVIQVTRGPRTWQVVAIGAMVATMAAGLGALGVWWAMGARSGTSVADLSDRPAAPVAVAPTATATVGPDSPPPDAATEPTATPAAAPSATGRRLLPPTPRPTDPAPTAVPPTTGEPRATEALPPSTAERTEPMPSAPTEEAALGPSEFLGEAVVNGRRLVLDYIAYLPSGAFAEINGIEVRLGSEIEGFTVESITAAAVTLRGPDGAFVLRAR